jgi:radical SAM superfamily enzyme YgiQ (UPF0313 family)
MHTATRLAVKVIGAVKALNPTAHLCCYGLYAAMNEVYLRKLGVKAILAGEFEPALVDLAEQLKHGVNNDQERSVISFERLNFVKPDRSGLPPFEQYASLCFDGTSKRVGYTEASRGCKHVCRHCPVVPIYNGRFRVVQRDIVLEDIRQQVERGAGHITFGDPDFLNGPAHAVRIVRALHDEHPGVTYDVTIKIEHLLRHRELLPVLKETGCLFVTSAVESVEDEVLEKLDKDHSRNDFIEVVQEFRKTGLALSPTFVPFTPWTTRAGYQELLRLLVELELVDSVAPIQLALRLLIPRSSKLFELPEVREMAGPFDEAGLVYPWKHHDPDIDCLGARVLRLVGAEERKKALRREIFEKIWKLAHDEPLPEDFNLTPRAAIPYLNEPWYC